MTTTQRIAGFKVFIHGGKEVSQDTYDKAVEAALPKKPALSTRVQLNGPHHDAKWAKDLLGTNLSSKNRWRKVNGLVLV